MWNVNFVVSGFYLRSPVAAKSKRNIKMKKNPHSIQALLICSFHKCFLNSYNTSLISLWKGFSAEPLCDNSFFFFSLRNILVKLACWAPPKALLGIIVRQNHTVHECTTKKGMPDFANLQSPPFSPSTSPSSWLLLILIHSFSFLLCMHIG